MGYCCCAGGAEGAAFARDNGVEILVECMGWGPPRPGWKGSVEGGRMFPLKCWYNRLLFPCFEHSAALEGLTRAAMAVAPPWGMVLLRPGPPGPMPTF